MKDSLRLLLTLAEILSVASMIWAGFELWRQRYRRLCLAVLAQALCLSEVANASVWLYAVNNPTGRSTDGPITQEALSWIILSCVLTAAGVIIMLMIKLTRKISPRERI